MNTIKFHWDAYHKRVIPEGAPDVQIIESRRAFYAGAQAILTIMWLLGGDEVSEDVGAQVIEGLHQEARAFAQDVVKGQA